MKKVILVTGSSSGIGLASVEILVQAGHIVYGSYRSDADVQSIQAVGGLAIELDMKNGSSLESAVNQIITEQGRIDVLFNNAGYGLFGPVEEISMEDARQQFEVNLFGLARLTQLVLPHLRAQKSGLIINTSSMGGKVYTPLGAWYHATKYALEGWSDCLRLELKQFGIDVVIIEPGGIQTNWGDRAADNLQRVTRSGPYKQFGEKVARSLRARYAKNGSLSSPQVIADIVARAVSARRPRTRYVAGKFARPLMFIRKYFGDQVYDWVVMQSLK